MMGFDSIAESPISSVEAADPVFGAAAKFLGRALLSALPLTGIFLSEVAMDASAALAASPVASRPGAALMEGSASLTARPRVAYRGATVLYGSASLYADVEFRLYAATDEWATLPTDSRPNYPFVGTLKKAVRFDRSILNGGSVGQVTVGWGEMELINAEQDYDHLVETHAVDGRRVVLRVGDKNAGYDSFYTIFDLTAKGWHIDENVLRIFLRDHAYKLEVPVQSALYGGEGNLDGNEDLKGKRKPLVLGDVSNITPQQLVMTPAQLVWQVSGGPVEAIPAVYDNAVALTPAVPPDYANSALLLAATDGPASGGADIEAGEYATCLSEGLFRLGGQPVGTITCDVQGDKTGGVYASTTTSIVRRLVTRMDASARFDEPCMAQTDEEQPAVVGYYLPTGSETNAADVIADLMNGIGGWAGYRRNGVFSASVFKLPIAPPSASYSQLEIVDIQREKLPDGMEPPPYRQRVVWGRNWTVQTDVSGGAGVTEEREAFLKESQRLATSSSERERIIKSNHPLAQDPAERQAYFRDEAPAQAESDRLLDMLSQPLSLYRITLRGVPFIHDIGDVISVTYPRWNLRSGKLLRLVSIGEDTDDSSGTTVLTGLG